MKKPKLSVIDADGLIFKAAWAYRESMNTGAVFAVQEEVDKQISALLNITRADHYIGFFGLENCKNFRYDVGTVKPYKLNRKKQEWMSYFQPKIKKHFEKKWGFYGVGDIEADDCLPIVFNMLKDEYDITLIYEDKDLRQIRNHRNYNFGKREFYNYSEFEGNYNLWSQVIAGDSSDNVPGIPKKGPKAAEKILDECETEEEMYEAVKLAYIEHYGSADHGIDMMLEQYILVKMLDKPRFDFPTDFLIKPFKINKKQKKKNLLDI